MKSLIAVCLLFACEWIWAVPTTSESETEKKAKLFLKKYCYECHGEGGSNKGGIGSILNTPALVAQKKIHAGDPNASPLYQRILNHENPMPPRYRKKKWSPDLLKDFEQRKGDIKNWITSLAKTPKKEALTGPTYPYIQILKTVCKDLKQVPEKDRPWKRYFTFHALAGRGFSATYLSSVAEATMKMMNHLSGSPEINLGDRRDLKEDFLLRIDLRKFSWSQSKWSQFLTFADYPYTIQGQSGTPIAKQLELLKTLSQSKQVPFVRADWFVNVTTHPKVYNQLRPHPQSFLETSSDIRSGFLHSGVSVAPRIIRRQEIGTKDGEPLPYWDTFDFDVSSNENTSRSNIFIAPLALDDKKQLQESVEEKFFFQHAGGEAIYMLKNHLLAYKLYNNTGQELVRGPIQVVDSPNHHNGILNFSSCIQCHQDGFINREDDLHKFVSHDDNEFPEAVIDFIESKHIKPEQLRDRIAKDNKLYKEALKKVDPSGTGMQQVLDIAAEFRKPISKTALLKEIPDLNPKSERYYVLRERQPTPHELLKKLFPGGSERQSP